MTVRFPKQLYTTLLLAAFLCNILIPFAASSQAPDTLTPSYQGKILICTASGFQWVHPFDFPTNDTHHTPSGHDCALCFNASSCSPSLAPQDALELITLLRRPTYAGFHAQLPARRTHFISEAHSIRAPPPIRHT